MFRRAILVIALAAAIAPAGLTAQDVEIRIAPPRDSIVEHAFKLATSGDPTEARRVLDSVLATNSADEAVYGEALYWRGALAEADADAERDFRRLLIEAPLSARAEDAILQLAQLNHTRGDRSGASDYLQRYLLSYPNDDSRPERPKIALWFVRLLFEQNMVARGCDAMRIGRDALANESLEMKNQLEFYAPRCDYIEVAGAQPQGDTTKPTGGAGAAPATRARPPAEPAAATAKSFWSVQVAAYDSEAAAQRMAQGLVSRGLDARVDGSKRPFRVRIGRYPTRADAVKMAQSLKAQGQNGFVTQVTPPATKPN